jgi:hypothetical protein
VDAREEYRKNSRNIAKQGGGLPGVSGFENHIQCQLILRNGRRKFEKQAFSGHDHSNISHQPSGQLFSGSGKYDKATGSNHSAIASSADAATPSAFENPWAE